MCTILFYSDYVKRCTEKKKLMSRTEALIKGLIETYTCDSCGGDFEVINEQFPERCPCCNMEMEWED